MVSEMFAQMPSLLLRSTTGHPRTKKLVFLQFLKCVILDVRSPLGKCTEGVAGSFQLGIQTHPQTNNFGCLA